MKVEFDADNELRLIKTKVVRGIFLENNKYYSQIFLDECLSKI